MAPNTKCVPNTRKKLSRVFAESDGDEIVISGMSGRFPSSRNIAEFEHNLFNKVDMVTEKARWDKVNLKLPKRYGLIDDLDYFDAMFFGVHFKQAHNMDPQCRIILECAYEAVVDAGVNPKTLRGTRTGVYIGNSLAESDKLMFEERSTGFGITGASRAMLANRISYVLGLNGPSFCMDATESSTSHSLDTAFTALRNGEIDAAIVGGTNLVLHPFVVYNYGSLGVLSPDGVSRPFDRDCNGYARSEAIPCVFLQKKRDAKRVYATFVYSKINHDGFKEHGILHADSRMQEDLITNFYKTLNFNVNNLGYLETHCLGSVKLDAEECRAIESAICDKRNSPLPVGSVVSNMGNTEPSSGLCAVIKILLAFQNNKIPPNIHLQNIRQDIPALVNGKIRPLVETIDLPSPFVAINSHGYSGVNSHILLKSFGKRKENQGIPKDSLPRLVLWSGRTNDSINNIFSLIEQKPLDAELVALLNDFQSESIPGFVYRGFALYNQVDQENAVCVTKDVIHFTGIKKPLVWVFSGMGSQWIEMGTALMNIEIFKQAIYECHEILKLKNLDLLDILTSKDPTTFDNILHSFVGIAAIQIGIIDILRSLDITPDYIIGHSVGELGCGYADNALTAEQTILSAYYRGKVSLEIEKIRGSMAAVGLGYAKIAPIIPPNIDVACHNSDTSCTISGPAEDVNHFVADLKSKYVFAKEVPCSNIAYHSRYIAHMGPTLLQYLQQVIPNPRKRSSKWLSTSVPKAKWDLPESNLCSAEYYTNNLLSSVLFEETSALLPQEILTIEIAPHALLQAIIKRSMPKAVHIGLTQRGNPNNDQYFLTALGKLFINGEDMRINRIYSPVEFPVSVETPSISSTMRWEHKIQWFTMKFIDKTARSIGERTYDIDINSDEYSYLNGNVIDGRIFVPSSLYLKWAWEVFSAMQSETESKELPAIEFEDVRFLQPVVIDSANVARFLMTVQVGTGRFETMFDGQLIVSGTIRKIESGPASQLPTATASENQIILPTKCFYKEMYFRGYHFKNPFKCVKEAHMDGWAGKIHWNGKWVPFMESLFHLILFRESSRNLILPTRIDVIRLDFNRHLEQLSNGQETEIDFEVADKGLNRITCGGLDITGLHTEILPKAKQWGAVVNERHQFIPSVPSPLMTIPDAIRICVETALENDLVSHIKVVEVDLDSCTPIVQYFYQSLLEVPLVSGFLTLLSQQKVKLFGIHVENGQLSAATNCTFVIAPKLLTRSQLMSQCQQSLHPSGYVISREDTRIDVAKLQAPPNFNIIHVIPVQNEVLVVMQRIKQINIKNATTVFVLDSDKKYSWIKNIQQGMKNGPVFVVSYNDKFNGLLRIVHFLRKEPNGRLLQGFIINDSNAPKFDANLPFYRNQLKLGLAINIYKNGKWGTYKHLELLSDIKEISHKGHVYTTINSRKESTVSTWFQGHMSEKDQEIKAVYAALQFDCSSRQNRNSGGISTSVNYSKNVTGLEFSGVDKHGARYMGLSPQLDITSHIKLDTKLIFQVPNEWTLAEAATIPLSYITAYWCFFFVGDIRKAKSVLIHCGCSGVGLAAIRIALAYGLEVFTTVSSQERKKFLLKTFNKLSESHIGSSRDSSFKEIVITQTDGKGVDLVLNPLPIDLLAASLRCVAQEGTCIHIGKNDMIENRKLGMKILFFGKSLRTVLIKNIYSAPVNVITELKKLIDDAIKCGTIRPLPFTIYKPNELQQAKQYLESNIHIGKVLLQIYENATSLATLPLKAKPQVYFSPDLVYIVSGGLENFGLELVSWMIERNARKFILNSKKGVSTFYQAYRIRLFEDRCAKIVVRSDDVANQQACMTLFKEAARIGPIGGIIANHVTEDFSESMVSKAIATIHLDEFSRKMCPNLQTFILFTNTVCNQEKDVQSTLGIANSIMQTIIEGRSEAGLPAKIVKWGSIAEITCEVDDNDFFSEQEIGGILPQKLLSCFNELDFLILSKDCVVSSQILARKNLCTTGRRNILETVTEIVGWRDFQRFTANPSLNDMPLDYLAIKELRSILEKEYDIAWNFENDDQITLHQVLDMCQQYERQGYDVELRFMCDNKPTFGEMLLGGGLGIEFESMAKVMPITSSSGSVDNHCLIIPGFEGVISQTLNKLCYNIRSRCFLAKLTMMARAKRADDIAKQLVHDIQREVFDQVGEPFYIIGYSFGALVAIELARVLEQAGLNGKLLLIDSSPTYLRTLCNDYMMGNICDDNIQIMVLTSLVSHLLPNEPMESVKEFFAKFVTWEERIKHINIYLQKQNNYSKDYILNMAEGLYNRIKIVFDNRIDRANKIVADITLVRPSVISLIDIAQDYELSQYTTGKVNVQYIDGNHITMLRNPKLVKAINESDPSLSAAKKFAEYITI